MQHCSNSIANALELLQSCTNPSIWFMIVLIVAYVVILIPVGLKGIVVVRTISPSVCPHVISWHQIYCFRAQNISVMYQVHSRCSQCQDHHKSHIAPVPYPITEMCTFLFWMVHYGTWYRCIAGFVKLTYEAIRRHSADQRDKHIFVMMICFNSSPHSAAYMRQWAVSALVQVMVCSCSELSHYLN